MEEKKYIRLSEEQKKSIEAKETRYIEHFDVSPYDITRKMAHIIAESMDDEIMKNILAIAKEKGFTDVFAYNKNEIGKALSKNIPMNVMHGQGVAPYCPFCRSGEWMTNEDGSQNAFCGQCGQALNWKEIESEDEK